MVPHGDRSGVVIEPYLTDQWYVDAKTHGAARHRGGAHRARPPSCRRTGKRPISSGWRTSSPGASPASSGGVTRFRPGTGRTARYSSPRPKRRRSATRSAITSSRKSSRRSRGGRWRSTRNKRAGFITRDEDVLDTWFSSALWPFSTLGWPDDDTDVKRYYPTNVLVTGFDIIFFWVARMMMMGLHFMKEVPFSTVYIHAPRSRREGREDVEVERQRHRSPWRLIDDYGADALRFTLARDGGAGPRHQALRRSASRAIATSRPSCGTPAASPR